MSTDSPMRLHQYPACARHDSCESKSFWSELSTSGCAVIAFPSSSSSSPSSSSSSSLPSSLHITSDEISNITQSMSVLQGAFHITQEEKEKLVKYHMEKGLNYGYRVDGTKEFLETRIRYKCVGMRGVPRTTESSSAKCFATTSNGSNNGKESSSNSSEDEDSQERLFRVPEPEIPIEGYSASVDKLFRTLSKVSIDLLKGLAKRIGLHEDTFVSLTDLVDHLDNDDSIAASRVQYSAPPLPGQISASLLRVCRYPPSDRDQNSRDNDETASLSDSVFRQVFDKEAKEIQFGAHTDTSFLTLGIVSKTPGLEIMRKSEMNWYPIEFFANKSPDAKPDDVKIVVFLGELLHMVTKGVYEACVHRVVSYHRAFNAESLSDRISCPFIVRGKLSAVVRWRDPRAFYHPGGDEALASLPDFDGLSMKLLHKFLDMKRAKCVEANKSSGGSGDGSDIATSAGTNDAEWILQSSLSKK